MHKNLEWVCLEQLIVCLVSTYCLSGMDFERLQFKEQVVPATVWCNHTDEKLG